MPLVQDQPSERQYRFGLRSGSRSRSDIRFISLQRCLTYLVSLADFTNNVLLGNFDVVESKLTSGRRLDTELTVSDAQRVQITFFSFLVISTPMSLVMTKQVIPLYPADGSTLANTYLSAVPTSAVESLQGKSRPRLSWRSTCLLAAGIDG